MSKLIDTGITRRALIESGLLLGVGSATLPAVATAALHLPLIQKKIPSTGEPLPCMGIGTNAFRDSNYEALRDVLKGMHDLGGIVIDTAAAYGDSELVIGKALAGLKLRNQMFIATKFNALGGIRAPTGPAPPETVFGEASFDRSLLRLQTDRIDLMQIHSLGSVVPLMPLLQELKAARKVRYIGITTVSVQDHPQLIEYMRKYPIDFIQVDYSLGARESAETVFPVARERKIAVMAAVPLGGRRGPLISQTQDRPLPAWAADIDVTTWSQFFLKYVISHPDVTCAIPGSSRLDHLQDNQMAGHGRVPDVAMRKRMEELWDNDQTR